MLCFFNQNAPREISEFRATPAWVYLGLFWVCFGSILGLFWVYFGSDLMARMPMAMAAMMTATME